ncbi:MAG: hypothetical protein HC836_34415 [Richelia sp. RM2_1_2]|nr:hypothetical protein [Richelia sp. RM1_1_1]NJO63131.1 hypothetical protein [Richelia sp. RM2_1_2]
MTLSKFIIASFAIFLASCGNSSFNTQAIYDAPVTGYRITVSGSGTIESGADISNNGIGKISISPLLKNNFPKIIISINYQNGKNDIIAFIGNKKVILERPHLAQDNLTQLLKLARYANLEMAEVSESAEAINGVLGGPKATIMNGQSDHLIVIDVNYNYK